MTRRPVPAASLREDYLNQVQRDFLSRGSHEGHSNTPSERTGPKRTMPNKMIALVAGTLPDSRARKAFGPHKAGRSGPKRAEEGWRAQSKTGVSTPSTLCSLGLVVVYCSSTRFSGKM